MKKYLFIALIVFAGCKTNPLIQPVFSPGTTNIQFYVPAAPLTNAIAIANQVAPLIPAPFGEIASGVLALATAGLGLYAKAKSNQLSTSQSMLSSVITGVEKGGTPQTKQAIQQSSVAAGVADQLDNAVHQITSQLPKGS